MGGGLEGGGTLLRARGVPFLVATSIALPPAAAVPFAAVVGRLRAAVTELPAA